MQPFEPPAPPHPGANLPAHQRFIGKHWKWLVPVGCLGFVMLIGAGVCGLLLVIFAAIKNTEVYQTAIDVARAHPEVRRELGDPVETGWYVTGSVQVSGPSGHADVSVPLTGSRASGTLYGVADKSAGRWTFSLLEVEVEGRPARIDLRSPSP